MHDIGQAFLTAVALIRSFDPELIGIVSLSLRVSLSAAVIAMVLGAPLGGALAVLWSGCGDVMRVDGAANGRSIRELFMIGRGALLPAFLAAFGRAIAE